MMVTAQYKKVVLAYSGGLDTSVILHWLKAQYGCEIICYCADVGQGNELVGLKERALATGATNLFVRDLREEFVRNYVNIAVKAGAVYEGQYLLGTALARPLIAKYQIELAREENADTVAHGATGKGNDQLRFELSYYALMPSIKVIAPWRTWPFGGRKELLEYAKKHSIPTPVTSERPYSSDSNIMHISYEGGILEDPWMEPPGDLFIWTKNPEEAPSHPSYIEVSYREGEAVALNGKSMDSLSLLQRLNEIGAEHGIGRVDWVENRAIGIKSRGIYETPGVTLLHVAYRALESITLDREVLRLRMDLGTQLAEKIYNGFWFAPETELMRKTICEIAHTVTGDVRLKLYKGTAIVTGRRSEKSLYRQNLSTFESEESSFNPKDAEGFIRLTALRLQPFKPA